MPQSRTFARLVSRLALVTTFASATFAAAGSDWAPTRPVKLIVPSTAGAAADTTARLFSQRLATALGQPVVVENRGGAGGLIGTEAAAKTAPDGHTLVLGSDYAFTIYPQLRKPPFDPVKDFEPVGLVTNLPMVLVVNPQRVAANNLKELIGLAKANPGKLTIASAGNGSSHHLAAEYFKHQAGIYLLHIPYKGAAEAMTDVLSGQVDMMFISPGTVIPHLKSGKVKAIGVSVARRVLALPDVPTLAEAGLRGFDIGIWFGIFYPAGTPKAAVERVNAELQKILEVPEVRTRLIETGYTPAGGKPEVLGQRIASDTTRFRKIVQDTKITLD